MLISMLFAGICNLFFPFISSLINFDKLNRIYFGIILRLITGLSLGPAIPG